MMRFLSCLLAGILSLAAGAAPPVALGHGDRQPLAGHLDMLTGPPAATLEEALQAAAEGRFRPIPGNAAQGYGPHDVWLRFSLDVPEGASPETWLEVGPPFLQRVTLYQPLPGGGYRASVTGAWLPFRERSLAHPNLLFRLGGAAQPLPGPRSTCYLQVRTRSARLVRPVLWSPEAYGEAAAIEALLQGAFLGITLILVIANALYGIRLRAATQLSYAGYLVSMMLMFAGLEGLAGQFLFPGSAAASRILVPIAISLQPWFAVALFSSLTDFGKAHPRLDLAYRWFGGGTTIVLLLASFVGRYYDVAATGQAAILVIVVANTLGAICPVPGRG